ncbi:Ras-related protein Rab-8B [Geodia barretti]|uniref:Ras-related protein Rab-8B n=1 Tax=Geodia barretti TaxID=519541 RepID=A0AA35TGN8_GEOBA|nr:Ras-related protein Rab-8B [Geodia barretti]
MASSRAPYEEVKKLGAGSYDEVYLIKYNRKEYAAKVLHRLRLDPDDPGTATYTDRFKAECERLKSLSHDCVVKYIQTIIRSDTNLPVLIMELCGESLTKFLEHSPTKPLPYHVELNISIDVARALEYLHENSIIHRDLSSNNVLMVAGNRVKVSDFGMSKLDSVDPNRSLTICPGNLNYMSPQTFSNPPKYTAKLDIFSFGVLSVQIVTRQEPNPTDRHQPIPHQSPGVCREVPEVKRRAAHLEMIADEHPLKPVSLKCLTDEEEGRPTAASLVQTLKSLRGEEKYTQSYEKELHRSHAQKEREREKRMEKSHRSRHRSRSHPRVQLLPNEIKLKLLMVGQSGVGKTCALRVYNGEKFACQECTVGVDFCTKTVQHNNHSITLDIWDSAGQEKYNALTKAYFHGAQGVLVMYDVTHHESYKVASDWIKATNMNLGDAEMLLVGNKTDLQDRRQVRDMDGRNLAQEHNISFIEASALRNENIEEAFSMLVGNIMTKQSYEKELHRSHAHKEREREKRMEKRHRSRHRSRRHPRVQLLPNEIKLKLLVVGQSGVGKTCALRVYNGEEFASMDFCTKTVQHNNHSITLDIWDSAGQEKYNALTKAYFRGAQNVGDAEMVLVGNKTDLQDRRQVRDMDGRNLAQEHNISFIETSALRNENIEEAFSMLVGNIMTKQPHTMRATSPSITLDIDEDEDEEREKRSCCLGRRH